MGSDEQLMYIFYFDETGEMLGGVYDFDGVGEFYKLMFSERGLYPDEIRAERV